MSQYFKTTCANCRKEIFTFLKSRVGYPHSVFCSKVCEKQFNYDKRHK